MAISQETFIVQVHEDGGAVLENVRTRECVWLSQLSEIAVHITGWLDDPERHPPLRVRERAPVPRR